jgi:acetylornithine deacetylase/succinyl-diaminopimelate desuccinylase-like protein
MSSDMNTVHDWLNAHLTESVEELAQFLRIESVSTQPHHSRDVEKAALWLRNAFTAMGMSAELHPTGGHPIVLAEWRGAPPGAPTILIYAHYDVQPVEPLAEWTSPPFEPTVRDNRLYARGAADDKGQLWIHLMAIRAHMACHGALPVNVVILVEGEEEMGSKHLRPFIDAQCGRLAADCIVISDTPMFAEGIPSVLSSLRGMAYFEIRCQGPSSDLHSGQYGGAVRNPAATLSRILASLHGDDDTVAVRGFYDEVQNQAPADRARIRALPFDEELFKSEIGVTALAGEKDFEVLERLWKRPTCEVNGILSGYTGEGAKTVLPASAFAKVSFRLVPAQTPQEIERLLASHIAGLAADGVTTTVRMLHGGMPWSADVAGPAFDAAQRALTTAFGRAAVIAGSGGSIPIVRDLEDALGAPVLLIGFGLVGENAHAPNEWLSLNNFRLGAHAIAELFVELVQLPELAESHA